MPLEEAVWIDPARMSGVPRFRGTRLPAQQLFDWSEEGISLDDFLHDFQVDLRAVLPPQDSRRSLRRAAYPQLPTKARAPAPPVGTQPGSPLSQQTAVRSLRRRPSSQVWKECMNKSEISDRVANPPGLDEATVEDAANYVFEAECEKARFEGRGSSPIASPSSLDGLNHWQARSCRLRNQLCCC